MIKKNDRKTINAWAFYDWANSAYPLVVTTSIFPLFYQAMTAGDSRIIDGNEVSIVKFFGIEFINSELYSYVLSASFLIVVLISPFLSGVADVAGRKKFFLKVFCYIGALGCAMLTFFDAAHLEISMIAVLLASVGYWGSLVFYNAYLPEISAKSLQDSVSARGYAIGYVGSAILLLLILILNETVSMPYKYAFLMVAVWWAGFAQYTYYVIPENIQNREPVKKDLFSKGFKELKMVWTELKDQKNLKRFLRSFFVYSMGVQTIILMAVLFAAKEIDWGDQGDFGMILSILIIQFLGAIGANFFASMSKKFGNKLVLSVALFIWMLICLVAYFIHQPIEFYLMAGAVGFVMGGIQALSRSTYSKMLPKTIDNASYFSFYDVVEKLGIVVGTFSFGLIEGITSSMRNSALIMLSYFIIGFVLLLLVKNEKSISAVKPKIV